MLVGLVVGLVAIPSCTTVSGHRPMMGGGMMGGGTADSPGVTIAGAPTVDIEATEFDFTPARIEVKAGEPFNLNLTNRGNLFHDITIPDLDLGLVADPGSSAAGGIDDLKAGEYRFECSVPGHAAAGMVGVLVVTS